MERVPYLPETPEELTAQWLGEALEGEVSRVNHRFLGEGVGFMGDVLLLELESSSEHLPSQLVAKLPQKANRVMGEMLGVYEREIMFFREFGDRLPIRIPKPWYAEFDRDAGSENQKEILAQLDRLPLFFSKAINGLGVFIAGRKQRRYMLLIEYLQAYTPGDQLAGIDASQANRVLLEVAQLHAGYWNDSSLDDHFWLLPLHIDAKLRHGIFRQHVQKFQAQMPDAVTPHLQWMKDHGLEMRKKLVDESPQTLLHCDLRLDNVLFGEDHCALIDWQLVRFGPAAYDVAYFVTSAVHADTPESAVEDLLTTYHQALGVDSYTYEAFKRDYQRGLMMVLADLSSVDNVELGDGRGLRMMQAWLERLSARVAQVPVDNLL